jgi:TolB-like protein/Tfp pilus assembly protein PilF
MGVLVLAISFGLAHLTRSRTPPPASLVRGAETKPRLAVLPLDDDTSGSETLLAGGLSDEIRAVVGRLLANRVTVIARSSTLAFRERPHTIDDVSRTLRARYIVEGNVRRDGPRVRIAVSLVDARDGAELWSDVFEALPGQAPPLGQRIGVAVTRALAGRTGDRGRLAGRAAATPEAWEAYLRGRQLADNGDLAGLGRALDEFERAAQLDPKYAPAWAAQADLLHRMVMIGQRAPRDAYEAARVSAQRAIDADPMLADGFAAEGLVRLWHDWNPTAAASSFERALSFDPSHAAARHDLAWSLLALGRHDEAVQEIERARDLDPLSPRAAADVGWLLLQARRPADAVAACERSLALFPDHLEAQACLERAEATRGQLVAAWEAARRAKGEPVSSGATLEENASAAAAALRQLWRERLDRLEAADRAGRHSPYMIAMHAALIGRTDRAIDVLRDAVDQRSPMMLLLPTDPAWDSLRGDARFAQLVTRVRISAS